MDEAEPKTIPSTCERLRRMKTRGELGVAIAEIVLRYSSLDLQQMKGHFSEKIQTFSPEYRRSLEETITAHLHGTYQQIRLMNQQGSFRAMPDSVPEKGPEFWRMVASHCSTGRNDRLRFLKYLLSGFCMLVLGTPGHPVGMPFPGGDTVELLNGIYYCPVRTKAGDVDAALCPFCPALQTLDVGYLKPPVKASEHRKQEFIKDCYEYHHFNG